MAYLGLEEGGMAESGTLLARIAGGARQLGLGLIVLGVLTALTPTVAGGAAVVVIGLLVLLAGLVCLTFGWQAWSADKGALGLAIGGITTACGLALTFNPVSSLGVVTSLVAAYMVITGISGLFFGQRFSSHDGQGWIIGDALFSLALGVSMWVGWPLSGVRALGMLTGLKLASAGAVMLRIERAVQRGRDHLQRLSDRLGRLGEE
jgi:uncharacterized membrane protein HdeD (DUF308 family)